MKNNLNRQETEKEIKRIFLNNPDRDKIKKAKTLAMSRNLKLGELKKKFCKKCYSVFNSQNSSIRIKNGFKTIKCRCGNVSRYKLK